MVSWFPCPPLHIYFQLTRVLSANNTEDWDPQNPNDLVPWPDDAKEWDSRRHRRELFKREASAWFST